VQLIQSETVFRSLKSELGIRPVFHQLEHHVDAHILIAFVAYCLQVTLKNRLMIRAQGLDASGCSEKPGSSSNDRCPHPHRRRAMADSAPVHPAGSGGEDDLRPAETRFARASQHGSVLQSTPTLPVDRDLR